MTLQKHGLSDSGMVNQATEESMMSVRYNDLLAPMIRAIQELNATVQEQSATAKNRQSTVQELGTLVREQSAAIEAQQKQIAQLQAMLKTNDSLGSTGH